MRTSQKLFDTVVEHLRKQKQKSFVYFDFLKEEYLCMYRSPEGHKCAIGCLIPDSEYSNDMEGRDLNDLLKLNLLVEETHYEFEKHKILLLALQNIHDNKKIEDWEKEFRMLAADFKLQYKQ